MVIFLIVSCFPYIIFVPVSQPLQRVTHILKNSNRFLGGFQGPGLLLEFSADMAAGSREIWLTVLVARDYVKTELSSALSPR
jgi:hypothetical protein